MMELTLGNNVQSLMNQRNLLLRTRSLNKDLEIASSGKRINTASDDAAGVSISDGLMNQIKGRKTASLAIQNGISILNTAERSLNITAEHIQKIRELTVQGASDEYSIEERRGILNEVVARVNDIDRVANATTFNKINLLDGSASQFRIQVGIDSDLNNNTINVGNVLSDARASALGLTAGINFTAAATGIFENGTAARAFLNTLDSALGVLNQRRAQIAAYQNRLTSTFDENLQSIENYNKSYSTIRDADIASVTADMAKQNIMRESTLNILMQSNSNSEIALSLLAA